jgi:uncharacterized protein YndB with AHSA1/START domain
MIAPIIHEFTVDCDALHAFDVWTSRTTAWWPVGHTVSAEPGVEIRLEPRVGGRIFERAPDGEEHDWGEIVAWEPPRRLAYLWHIRRDRADATDVEITFTPRGAGTVVRIVHTGWERLGDGSAWRDRNVGGWDGVLPAYRDACVTHGHRELRGA